MMPFFTYEGKSCLVTISIVVCFVIGLFTFFQFRSSKNNKRISSAQLPQEKIACSNSAVKILSELKTDEVCCLLESIGLDNYKSNIITNKVNGLFLSCCDTVEELTSLGISKPIHAKSLLKMIKEWNELGVRKDLIVRRTTPVTLNTAPIAPVSRTQSTTPATNVSVKVPTPAASAAVPPTPTILKGKSFTLQKVLGGHSGRVYSAVCLYSGKIVSSASDDTLRVWDISQGVKCEKILPCSKMSKMCMVLDGRVAGTDAVNYYIWDAEAGKLCARFMGQCVQSMAPLCDGRLITGGSSQLCIYNCQTTVCEKQWNAHEGDINTISCTNQYIFSGSADKKVKMWSALSHILHKTFTNDEKVNYLALLLSKTHFVCGADKFSVWNISTSAVEKSFYDSSSTKWIASLGDSSRFVSCKYGGTTFSIHHAFQRDPEYVIEHHHNTVVNSLTVLPDGRFLTVSSDTTIRVWA